MGRLLTTRVANTSQTGTKKPNILLGSLFGNRLRSMLQMLCPVKLCIIDNALRPACMCRKLGADARQ